MIVLVCEDNAIIGTWLGSVLADHDHEVLGPFATADQALRALATETPHAALLDYRLRGGTSVPVAEALAERHIPFCFLTGYSELAELPNALTNTLQLRKPMNETRVLRFLEALVEDTRSS